MLGLINGGKYKIIEILESNDDYEASLCMDVAVNNDYAMYIVNKYKSKTVLCEFLPLCYTLSKDSCRDFVELITSDGSVAALFKYYTGTKIYDFFVKGRVLTYEERMEYANLLLAAALELDMLEDYLAYCALQPDCVRVDKTNKRIGFNYIVPPKKEEIPENFKSSSLGAMLRAIFPRERYLPAEIEDFYMDVESGRYQSCLEIFSAWRTIRNAADKSHELYLKESIVQYFIRSFKRKKLLKKRRARLATQNN